MGKTRDHFKKIRNTKGIFHVRMGSIKDRNGMDLTEADGEGNGNHSSILAWRIPGTGEPAGLPSMGSCRVRYD